MILRLLVVTFTQTKGLSFLLYQNVYFFCKDSFPLIAKARCENFHPITIFESTRCELASWFLSGKEALCTQNKKYASFRYHQSNWNRNSYHIFAILDIFSFGRLVRYNQTIVRYQEIQDQWQIMV